jgi:hypothetical protein
MSHATAALLRPQNKVVHITASVKTRKKVPINDALIIEIHPGDTSQLTQPYMPALFRSAPARYLLENLQIAHRDVAAPRALGREWVETELCKLLERHGEAEINGIRDDARQYSAAANLTKEFKQVDALISALLSTRPMGALATPAAIAIAKKTPFDTKLYRVI